MPVTPGYSREPDARLTPRPPGAPGEVVGNGLRGFFGGNLIGRAASGLDDARGVEPGEASLLDRDVQLGGDPARMQGHADTSPRADADTVHSRSGRPE